MVASFPEATTVGRSAFKGCDSLMAVDASEARDIGREAFFGCYALGEFVGDSVENVGERGFYGCVPLAMFNFDSIKKVGSRAFYDTAVTSVPTSKSYCFEKDAFGSALNNVFKFVFKKKCAIITSYIAAQFGIATVLEVMNLVKMNKKHTQFVLNTQESINKCNAYITNFEQCIQMEANISHEYPDMDNYIMEYEHAKKAYVDEAADYQKILDDGNKSYANAATKWKWIIAATVLVTVASVGTTIYFWETET